MLIWNSFLCPLSERKTLKKNLFSQTNLVSVREIRARVVTQKLFHQAARLWPNTNLGKTTSTSSECDKPTEPRFLLKLPLLLMLAEGSGVRFLQLYCFSAMLCNVSDHSAMTISTTLCSVSDHWPWALEMLFGCINFWNCSAAFFTTLSSALPSCYSDGLTQEARLC